MTARQTLTLADLQRAALWAGFPAVVVNTGGNVYALSFASNGGKHALLSLDDGQREGETWTVSLDGETRETYGEAETDALPVTSDADQTIADAAAWVGHVTHGDPLDDGTGDGHAAGCGCH